jgi:hypothetical protein
MAFDEQGFRKAAAAAGYSADEIESHVAKEKQGAEPKLPEANTYEDFAGKEMANQPSAAKRLEQKASEVNPAIPYLGAAGVGALGAAAAMGAGKKIYNSLTDKMAADAAAKQAEAKRIEPELNVSNKPVPGEPTFDFSPVNTPPAPPAPPAPQPKPTVEQLKQKLGVAPPAAPVATAPVQQAPVAQAAPVEAVAPPAQAPIAEAPIVPAEPIAPLPAKPEKGKRVNRADIANNPPEVPGQPEMRPNYEKPAGINPETGKKFIGPGGYNWFASQVGHEEAPKRWEEQYGKVNVPHSQVEADYAATRYPPTPETIKGNMGGAAGRPEFIPKYIKGAASPSALATTAVVSALPALAAAAYQKYKGNEAAVDASIQEAKDSLKSLATMPYDVSKAASKGNFGPLKDMLMSMNPGSLLFNETSKNDEEILKKMIYKEKVGAGRGIAPPTR